MDVISKLEKRGQDRWVLTPSLLFDPAVRTVGIKKDRSQSDWGGPSIKKDRSQSDWGGPS